MTDEEAQVQLARDIAFAEGALTRFGGLAPLFIIGAKDGPMVVAAPFRNEAEKAETYLLIEMACVAHEADWLCFMDEAWLVQTAPGEPLLVEPKDSDRRVEVAMISLTYRRPGALGTKHLTVTRSILRDGDGKATGFGPSPIGEAPMDGAGRATRILPALPPHPVQVEIARMALDTSGALRTLPTAGRG
jgi:hypothetical protein